MTQDEHLKLAPSDSGAGLRRELVQLEARLAARIDALGGPATPPAASAAAAAEPGMGPGLWGCLWRRKLALSAAATAGALAGLLFSLPQTPIYQARASIEIQGRNENFLNMKDVDPAAGNDSAEAYLATQISMLQSESLLRRVVAKMKLVERPEFRPHRNLLTGWFQAPLPPAEAARETLAKHLKVRQPRGTRLVEILYDSPDPALAAELVNTLASESIEHNLEQRWNAAQRTGEWLTRQLQDLKGQLKQSEDRLQGYAQSSGLLFISDKGSISEEKLRLLQEEYSKAQGQRAAQQSRYEIAISSPVESLSEVLDSAVLRSHQIKMGELRQQLAELGSSYTPAYYRVKRLQAQIAEAESALAKERANILHRISNEYQAAKRHEALLAAAFLEQTRLVSGLAGKAVQYNMLKREVDTNRNLYDAMLQRVKEAGIASAMRASNIRVVDAAEPPARPDRPQPVLAAGLGLVAGLLFGVALVIARGRADRSLRTPGDAAACLRVPELGVIPSLVADPWLASLGRGWRLTGPLKLAGGASSQSSVELATWQQKPSLMAESFRATLTSILLAGGSDRPAPGVVVVTGPALGVGKSTVASNLAIALAEIRRRVLLIDADLRRPRLHEIFEVPNTRGLSDLLAEEAEGRPEEYLQPTRVPGLWVLTAGSCAGGVGSLLGSARLSGLLAALREDFDMLLIDTPPMLHMADARVLGNCSDGVILVVRAGQTERETAQAAARRLAADGTTVLGVVLNDWNPRQTGESGYGEYYKYYDSAKR